MLEERTAEIVEVIGLMTRAERDLATSRLLQDKDEEWAFAAAYQAMARSARALILSEGYRPKGIAGQGHPEDSGDGVGRYSRRAVQEPDQQVRPDAKKISELHGRGGQDDIAVRGRAGDQGCGRVLRPGERQDQGKILADVTAERCSSACFKITPLSLKRGMPKGGGQIMPAKKKAAKKKATKKKATKKK